MQHNPRRPNPNPYNQYGGGYNSRLRYPRDSKTDAEGEDLGELEEVETQLDEKSS